LSVTINYKFLAHLNKVLEYTSEKYPLCVNTLICTAGLRACYSFNWQVSTWPA